MLLVLDIGNTNISVGVYDEDLVIQARFSSTERTADEAGLLLEGLLRSKNVPLNAIDGAILCCVVPNLEVAWRGAVKEYFGFDPLTVSHKLDLGIKIDVDFPGEVGADRLANAVGAAAKYGAPVIAVDLGISARR